MSGSDPKKIAAHIWFDTASKLPPEENLRILKAVREAKPDIVINSRIVFPYAGWPGPFGDYLSTGDRAVEFRPFEGDWKTIPTTNESYGYHKHDPTHKTPDYLIEVIAKAVAKGGNILLNVGPMGDGRIDPIDVNILKGIGQWMETYETQHSASRENHPHRPAPGTIHPPRQSVVSARLRVACRRKDSSRRSPNGNHAGPLACPDPCFSSG